MKIAIPIVAMLVLLLASPGRAAVKSEVVEYRHGDVILEGYLAYDDVVKGKRPGVLIVHEWMGHDEYARKRAEQLASLGYVTFALDMYGKGVRAKNNDEAAALAGIYRKDRKLMRARAQAGLDVLTKHALTDPARVAAIGYCFGGTTVLELARGGADVAGVVSFHGVLDSPDPGGIRAIKARVLVLHGAEDPYAPPDQVAAFETEMRRAGADWQLVVYGGAVHGFTNPAGGRDKTKGYAYDEKADRRSWEAMKGFFAEIFR